MSATERIKAIRQGGLAELVIVIVAMLAPQFLLASEVDGDEFLKGFGGIALVTGIVAAYRIWKGPHNAGQT